MSIEIGITSYTYRKLSIMDVLDRAKQIGTTAVDLWPDHLPQTATEAEVRRLRDRFADEGIRFCCYGVIPLNPTAPLERWFNTAKWLGADCLSVDVAADDIATQEKALAMAEERNLRLAVHNHGPKHRYSTPADVRKVIDRWPKRFGACVDTGHYLRSEVDPVQAIRQLAPRVYGVHIKDFIDVDNEALPGTGRLNLRDTIAALQDIGYQGAYVIEYEAGNVDPTPELLQVVAALRRAEAELAEKGA